MTDLFSPARPHRPLTPGETPCRTCGAAACFFFGFEGSVAAWCKDHAPADFRPGRQARHSGGEAIQTGAMSGADDVNAPTLTPPLQSHDLYSGETI